MLDFADFPDIYVLLPPVLFMIAASIAISHLLSPVKKTIPVAHGVDASLGHAYKKSCKDAVLQQRLAMFGPNCSLSYSPEPIMMVEGRGAYMYDEEGREYLDCVNNVAHVGHCHPKVTAATCQQLMHLNTNSRYMHPARVSYIRKLLATFPENSGLEVVYMVCSGSEANELALRMAKAYTQGTDIVCLGGAYHGHTEGLIEASPYKYEGKGGFDKKPHVHKAEAPDTYRGSYRSNHPNPGHSYANDVKELIDRDITSKGRKLAAFLAESVLGCSGQIVPPEGYLKEAFEHAKAAGGICIADEVQVGFGRCGEHFWSFAAQGAQPDIVTLGKPIGNGYPMAAVVTTRAVAKAFANGMEYFNTFGGSTAACATGEAVLDVIHEEHLQDHALHVGNILFAKLRDLQQTCQLMGDVRGTGLMIGIELVTDRENLTPATKEAAAVALLCRQRGVLVSRDGVYENVIKIKPPMCFSEKDASKLVSVFGTALKEVESKM